MKQRNKFLTVINFRASVAHKIRFFDVFRISFRENQVIYFVEIQLW